MTVQKNRARGRGRPRSFDPDRVLADVRDAFWKGGYAGTSMDQLVSATGLHKPSLYGAFGDKKKLYREALDAYLAEARREFGGALALPRLADGLAELAARGIDLFIRHGGCFMMATAVPEAREDPEIGRTVREAMDALDRALVRRFEKAIDEGELAPDADAQGLAAIVAANHYDLSARARAGYPREHLEALADQCLRLVERIGRPAA